MPRYTTNLHKLRIPSLQQFPRCIYGILKPRSAMKETTLAFLRLTILCCTNWCTPLTV
ncbi:hypothetical protein HanOQP8_Chr11g0392311 [Helianthus annuus]|nr:hypothetical protein HanOQP8_Chr11g0392311 [Helianthus annuus]